MKKIKKILSSSLAFFVLFSLLSTTVYASEPNDIPPVQIIESGNISEEEFKEHEAYIEANGNQNVYEINPTGRSIDIPNSAWSLKNQNRNDFAGSSNYKTMYTNYYYTDSNSNVYIQVYNYSRFDLTVTYKTRFNTYGKFSVQPGQWTRTTSSSPNSGAYLMFQSSYGFNGTDFSGCINNI